MPARKMPFFVFRSMARACPYATVPTIRADQARSKKHPRAGRAHIVIFRGRCAIHPSWNHVRLLARSSHNHGMRYNHSLAYISRSRVASVTQCDKGAAQNGHRSFLNDQGMECCPWCSRPGFRSAVKVSDSSQAWFRPGIAKHRGVHPRRRHRETIGTGGEVVRPRQKGRRMIALFDGSPTRSALDAGSSCALRLIVQPLRSPMQASSNHTKRLSTRRDASRSSVACITLRLTGLAALWMAFR